jgi:hypothetical protein
VRQSTDKEKKRRESYIFLDGVGTELPGKDIQDLLSNPTAFGECGESEIVRIYFS